MSIFRWLFRRKTPAPAGAGAPINVSGLFTIPIKCPLCGEVGDFRPDPGAHEFVGAFRLDAETVLHNLECPYCAAGMLLCLRGPHLLFIEGYKDESPADTFKAVERATKRLKG